MKTHALLSVSAGLMTAFASLGHAASVTWNGGDGDYLTDSNWSSSSVPNTSGGDAATINSGNVTYVAGGDLHIHSGGSLTVAGGSFTQTGGNSWMQFAGGSLNITGGVFNQGTAGNIIRNASTSITVSAGTANFNGNFVYDLANTGSLNLTGGTMNVQNEFKPITTITINGGSLNATLISFADGPGSIDFASGDVSVDGSSFYSGFYGGGAKSLNFTSGSSGTLFFRNYNLADLTADGFLTNGTLRSNGLINAGNFSAVEGDGGVYVGLAAVPEPAAPAFLLTGLLSVLAHRRRLAR